MGQKSGEGSSADLITGVLLKRPGKSFISEKHNLRQMRNETTPKKNTNVGQLRTGGRVCSAEAALLGEYHHHYKTHSQTLLQMWLMHDAELTIRPQ